LLTYSTDLEAEADRLRRQWQVVQQEGIEALQQIRLQRASSAESDEVRNRITDIEKIAPQLMAATGELPELCECQAVPDRVTNIGLRSFIEQAFRWQLRLLNAPHTVLRLELEVERLPWFPARLRRILDSLIAHAVASRDISKGETRLTLGVRLLSNGTELRVADNGKGISGMEWEDLCKSAPHDAADREDDPGADLAIVQRLVEQSGGTWTIEHSGKLGSAFVVVLPRYDLDDFLKGYVAVSPPGR
jgi:signal transduction histidine kinase